ncbi:Dihydrofolate reductase family protein [Sulfidibacter corallicola]|uniref:Dihydrofolate reductase family protein n=1 Tax=Sulfidibacter corallicola TaxID=2818388 RepID=A0A8A4TNI6_SULCO|nr:dihydrofolate reductase family protein [Sulfidibacter corallicola]QTD51549.1 dihydrofolate reductase family protein [Sulfidibacter corallicola]
MRELAILTFQTLDGVMQAPSMPQEDRSGGFDKGGWATDYWPEVMTQVQREAMSEPYDILFGRKTYELFAGHWPHERDTNPVAKIMNHATKYVATNTMSDFSWAHSSAISGDVPAEIAKLKEQDGPLIQVHGSCDLIQTLLAHDLIDEFRLWTFPVLVGGGKRLFADAHALAELQCIKSDVTENGVVMGIYKRKR